MEHQVFEASLDKLSKLIFVGVLVLFAFTILFIGIALKDQPLALVFPLLILSITLIGTLLYSPLRYIVSDEGIQIVRRINTFTIEGKMIDQVIAISKEDLGIALRLAGNGGMLGYTGWYTSKIGKTRWFVTQRKNYILIKITDKKQYLISPNDPEGFLLAVHAKPSL